MIATIWALWIVTGGASYGGSQWKPEVSAYFLTQKGCESAAAEVRKYYNKNLVYCHGGDYIQPLRVAK